MLFTGFLFTLNIFFSQIVNRYDSLSTFLLLFCNIVHYPAVLTAIRLLEVCVKVTKEIGWTYVILSAILTYNQYLKDIFFS